jgi:hypothetical protein
MNLHGPVYEEISGSHLDGKLRKGALAPPMKDDDRILESNETGEHYKGCRFKLVSKAVGDEIGPFRLLRVELAENSNSELVR